MVARVPLTTYRLQLTKDFGFAQAAALVPYLKELGITHLYASPFLAARPGSTHGYDIVDHSRLSPDLGGEEAFNRLSEALREADVGLILDFVPNHMGVGYSDNVWWLDVLEWGETSPHAASFDIDWQGLAFRRQAGLVYASHLTTVSETYAREITTPDYGCGLEGLLTKRARANELTGILNGIDESWDPRLCGDLAAAFGSGDWTSKKINADRLRKELGLALSRGPLFGLVARLVHQKGIDLLLETAEMIVGLGGQIVVMGRGEAHFEEAMQVAQSRHPKSIAVAIRYDGGEARRIFAGSDFTLMPSRFEPCGPAQMYGQRFASLPIGRNTGGLSETIDDGQTGFLFEQPSALSFLGGVCRAFSIYRNQKRLNSMREDAMAKSYSWSAPARAYGALYQTAVASAA